MHEMKVSYDPLFVGLSYAVSVFGAYVALQLIRRIPQGGGGTSFRWLSMAAIALGGGAIWAMHFIGMVAYDMGMPVQYDPWITLLSMLLAVAATGIGLWFLGRGDASFGKLMAGGAFTGLGVAGMHYLGMKAMRMPADVHYDEAIVAVSVVIAIVAATAAFWIAFHLHGTWQRFASAFVMGAAVCGMHYTGMAAMTMTPNDSTIPFDATSLTSQDLAFYVSLVAVGILGILFFAVIRPRLIERPLTDA